MSKQKGSVSCPRIHLTSLKYLNGNTIIQHTFLSANGIFHNVTGKAEAPPTRRRLGRGFASLPCRVVVSAVCIRSASSCCRPEIFRITNAVSKPRKETDTHRQCRVSRLDVQSGQNISTNQVAHINGEGGTPFHVQTERVGFVPANTSDLA